MNISKDKGYITNINFDQSEIKQARLIRGTSKTVKQWAKELGADIVVNASLFDWDTGIPIETYKSGGRTYRVSDWVKHGFGIGSDLKTILFGDFNENFYDYTCGFPTLIWECQKQDTKPYTTVQGKEPRTVFSKGDNGFCITTIDGRRSSKPGMTLDQAADYLRSQGMWYSCNLDGGDSTCVVVKNKNTGVYEVINSPSGTRYISNVLAIWLKDYSNAVDVSSLPTLRKGSKGVYVKELQNLLISKGYSCGSYGADGDFGGATYNAVVDYQRDNGLDVDGIVGQQTWRALKGK